MNAIAITSHKEMPKFLQEINAALTIAFREIINTIKSPEKIIPTIIMQFMFLVFMGGGISQNLGINMGFNFNEFMVVGMVINVLFMTTSQGITTLIEDRENDFTQEIFVSPVSRVSVIIGKTTGASITAYIPFLATIIMGIFMGVSVGDGKLLTLLAISPFICIVGSSIGVLLLGFIQKSSTMGVITMMVSMIQMFLGGAMFPINHSTGLISFFSHLMPMTYCLDFTRGLFYHGKPEYSQIVMYSPSFNLLIISVFTTIFFVVGTFFFVRSEKNK